MKMSNLVPTLSPIGGILIPMINLTGAASVKGTLVAVSGTAQGFVATATGYDAIGVVYQSGVADGGMCLIVIAGVAEVLLKDTTASTFGYFAQVSATSGRCEVTTAPAGLGALSTAEHFKEIGHCIETKVGGTNVLAKVVLHFN